MFQPAAVGNIVAGKYRVERVLGQGGMGVVVAARHLRLAERVAIKFPLARLHDRTDVVARLVREGRAAMRIRSEHVARVYDVGVLETGEPFLVMEYLDGRDLGAMLADAGPLPVGDAVEYVLQSLEAVSGAHACGIIHRDLKPSNLFLTRRADGSPMVKVIDFGISKITNADGEATLTDTAAVLGSRPFMAPEQMRAGRTVDARSDIWSLGATLHALLTGEPPFRAGSMVDIHERMKAGPPLLRSVRPDAPAALEAILLRCMRLDPAERYADAAALAAALAEVAPPHAQIHALRAARILSMPAPAGADADDGPPPAAADDAGSTVVVAAANDASRTSQQMMASWRDTMLASRAPGEPSGTLAPVTTSAVGTGAPARRARWFVAATILGGAATLAFVAVRNGDPASPAVPIAVSRLQAPPPAAASPSPAPPASTRPVDSPSPPSIPAIAVPSNDRSDGARRRVSAPSRDRLHAARPGAARVPSRESVHDLLADPD